VFVALDPGDIGGEIAMVLEEVEMPPGEFLEVMSFAGLPALRARKLGAPVGTDSDMELMR
jgi:hypothetical protein